MPTARLAFVALALGLALHAAPVAAGEDDREGFLIGFSLGVPSEIASLPPAYLGTAPLLSAAYGDFHVGRAFNRRLALVGEIGGGYAAASVQWWPVPAGRLWVRAGAGGWAVLEGAGPALVGTAGVEVLRRGRFTADLQVRGTTFWFDGQRAGYTVLGVGFNWY